MVLAVFLFAGCTGKACNDVGATSGVWFDVSQITANRTERVHVRACVGESCVARIASATRWNQFPVNDPAITGPGSVSVQLTITEVGGRSIFDEASEIQLHILQPNGPDCPPTAYVAAVAVTTDGQLAQLPNP